MKRKRRIEGIITPYFIENKVYIQRGFTLIEVMLSMTLVCILLSILLNFLSFSVIHWNEIQREVDIKQNVKIAHNYIEKRIRECNEIDITYDIENKRIQGKRYGGREVYIDLSGTIAREKNTVIYFYQNAKQIRVNKNGEHNVLAEYIKDIVLEEVIPGQLIQIEIFADHIDYSAKTRFKMNHYNKQE